MIEQKSSIGEIIAVVVLVTLFGLPLIAGVIALFAWITMSLWNAAIPAVIGWKALTMWQAVYLNMLCGFLFKSSSSKKEG